jgi:hypothetical protein
LLLTVLEPRQINLTVGLLLSSDALHRYLLPDSTLSLLLLLLLTHTTPRHTSSS